MRNDLRDVLRTIIEAQKEPHALWNNSAPVPPDDGWEPDPVRGDAPEHGEHLVRAVIALDGDKI